MLESLKKPWSTPGIAMPIVTALLLTIASGCVSIVDQTEWDWTLSPTISPVDWDSGQDQGLPVLSTDCSAITGNAHSLVAGLRGFKERAQNLDRFIASLNLECTPYVQFGGSYIQAVSSSRPIVTDTITTNLTFRTTSGERTIRVGAGNVPIGIEVYHNNRNYVQNLQMIFASEGNGVLADYVNWYDLGNYTQGTISDYPSIPQIGTMFTRVDSVTLLCPSQSVITGVRIRQSSNNGKIRFLGIDCQQLSNN